MRVFDPPLEQPSFLTPLLTHESFAVPVTTSTMAVLFAAAPTTHITGKLTVAKYKLWNPLRGGSSFVAAQTAGWSLYGAGFVLVCLDLVNKLITSHSSAAATTAAYLPCFTCTPGFLIGVAVRPALSIAHCLLFPVPTQTLALTSPLLCSSHTRSCSLSLATPASSARSTSTTPPTVARVRRARARPSSDAPSRASSPSSHSPPSSRATR